MRHLNICSWLYCFVACSFPPKIITIIIYVCCPDRYTMKRQVHPKFVVLSRHGHFWHRLDGWTQRVHWFHFDVQFFAVCARIHLNNVRLMKNAQIYKCMLVSLHSMKCSCFLVFVFFFFFLAEYVARTITKFIRELVHTIVCYCYAVYILNGCRGIPRKTHCHCSMHFDVEALTHKKNL